MGNDNELLKLAKKRVLVKRSLCWHLAIYIVVNTFLLLLFYFTTPTGYFWPFWTLFGWGIGLLCHTVSSAFLLRPPNGTKDAVTREYQRLLRETNDSSHS